MSAPQIKGFSHAASASGLAYCQGEVLAVDGNVALVQTSSSRIRVQTDLLRGKSDAPREGETWILDQQYGRWMFAVCVGRLGGGKFAQTVGDGILLVIPVKHDLGTQDITLSVRDASSNVGVATGWTWAATDADTVTLTFTSAPALNSRRVVVQG